MSNEIIIAIVSAIIGGAFTLLTGLVIEHCKEKREDKIEARKERSDIFNKRPEIAIVDYKDYTARPGYGIKQKCDIDLFVAHINNVTVTGNKKNDVVYAHYRESDFNPSDWCCVIYVFKNAGKTDISSIDIICNYKKDTCIFPSDNAASWGMDNLLNYVQCYDEKIRVGETITVKFCYHKDRVLKSQISANVSVGMIDDNGTCWIQPLFAPFNKVYDSRKISSKDYHNKMCTDIAEECFKKPWLW